MKYKNRKTLLLAATWLTVLAYLILYFLCSHSFLDLWPFVHSDESWLAFLSRDMAVNGDFGVTESFFDAKARVPHALRLLFHALQALFIRLFGFEIASVRLLSLLAGCLCLMLIFHIGRVLSGKVAGFLLMVLVSLDPSFLYASHFARQEILIALPLLLCLFIFLRAAKEEASLTRRDICLMATLTGISVGIHPNSFLVAAMCGCVLLFFLLAKKIKWSSLLLYTSLTGLIAGIFVAVSFSFTSTFLPDYFRQGADEYQLSSSPSGRFAEFLYYIQSTLNQESGTYYLPDLRLEFALFAAAFSFLLLALLVLGKSNEEPVILWRRQAGILITALFGLTAGMLMIGRFNQTSVLFYVLLGWLFVVLFLKLFEGRVPLLAMALISAFLLWNGYKEISPWLTGPTYKDFLAQLSLYVPADSVTLSNLNTAFYFDPGMFRDYRNLPYLNGEEALAAYIEDNKIQYILYTDELDYIYENRPTYNVIYGNSTFIKDLKSYLKTNCTLVGSFENARYASRILPILGNPDYGTVTIYRVLP